MGELIQPIDFINPTTDEIARQLLGQKLLINHGGFFLGGYMVEVEAYFGFEDIQINNNKLKPPVCTSSDKGLFS